MTHSFATRSRQSDSPAIRVRVETILASKIEARRFRWTDAGGPEDRAGVDVFALLPNRKSVGIDVKDNKWGEVRLEYVSRSGEGIVGWTVNDAKQTDYVLNLWPGRFWLIDFPSLKAVAKEMCDDYAKWYSAKATTSSGENGATWETRFIPVPVGRLLYDIYGQTVITTPLTADRRCPSCDHSHPVGTTCGSVA